MTRFTLRAALVLCLTASVACGGNGDDPAARAKTTSTAASPTQAAARAGEDRVLARIKTGSDPGYVTVAFGSVWAGLHAGNEIVRIAPTRDEITERFEVPGEPTGVSAGYGSLWTFTPLDGGTVKRIDPRSGRTTARIRVRGESGPLTGVVRAAGGMWFGGDGGVLERIGARSNRVDRTVKLSDDEVGCTSAVAEAAGSLWLASECGGEALLEIDPDQERVVGRVPIPEGFLSTVASGAGNLWAATQDGTLLRIDPQQRRITDEAEVADAAERLVVTPEAIWVRATADVLVRVDPETLEPTATVGLPEAGVTGGGLAAGAGALWVTNFDDGSVWRIEP